MAADEVAQSSATETDAPESAPVNEAPKSAPAGDACADDDVVADAWSWFLEGKRNFLYVCLLCKSNLITSFFLICLENNIFRSSVYGPLNVQTIVMARCFLGFN